MADPAIPVEIYPALSTTSDKPTETQAAAIEPEPIIGEPAEPDAIPTEETAEPAKPEPKRGRPSAADRRIATLEGSIAQLSALIQEKLGVTSAPPPAPAAAAEKPPVTPTEPRPKRADFTDPDEYDDALVEWSGRRAARAASEEAETRRAEREQAAQSAKAKKDAEDYTNKVAASWRRRRTEALTRYEDYEEVAENADTPMSVPMLHAIVESKYGPDIAYWLGEHRETAARIAAIASPIRQSLEIGRIEARVRRSLADSADQPTVATPPEPEPPLVQARPSALPRPIRPVRPQSEPTAPDTTTEDGSTARIERMLADLRKTNQPLGWGTVPSGARSVN